MNAYDLKQKLHEQSEAVCRHIFPNGKKVKKEWVLGNIHGDAGSSFSIALEGPRAGAWLDRANPTDKGKSLLSLWSKALCGGDMTAAIAQVKDFLGVKDDYDRNIKPSVPKVYKEPDKRGYKILAEGGATWKHLREDRMLVPDVLKAAKICQTPNDDAYVFPFFEGDTLRALKYVKLDRKDGKKVTWINPSGGAKPILFGMESIPKDADSIIITEGEVDSLSWRSVGLHAVSIPMGASNDEWITVCWDWLARFEQIYLSFDRDDAGEAAVKRVSERLGRERCYIVDTSPYKDFNEALADGIEYPENLLETATQIIPPEIQGFFDEPKELEDRLFETDETLTGVRTPWPKLPFGIRGGENTIITGFNGHGKTQACLQLCNHLSFHGWKGMIASMEVPLTETKAMLLQQAFARPDLAKPDLSIAKESHLNNIYFYDARGRVHWRKLLDCYLFGIKKYGMKYLIIDSFMLCGISKKDLDAQNEFMSEIQVMALQTGTHIFVIAHAKKPGQEGEKWAPEKYDIEGSGDLSNLAYNVIVVHRNITKEAKLDQAKRNNDFAKEQLAKMEPDGRIWLRKQKTGGRTERGKLGMQPVNFDMNSLQLYPQGDAPIVYINNQ